MEGRILALVLALPGLLGTTSALAKAPLHADVAITVTPGTRYSVTAAYKLSRPVKQLRFARSQPGLREKTWQIKTSHLAFHDSSLVSTDGKPFQRFSVQLGWVPGQVKLNYPPLIYFGDGSVAVFTGYLGIGENPEQTGFSFHAKGLNIILRGKPMREGEQWSPGEDVNFVYFGKLKPVETDSAIVMLDAALPAWVREQLATMVPATAAFYTKEYGVRLPEKPFFFMVWKPTPSGWSIHGDTLPGTVDMNIGGSHFSKETADSRAELGKVLAHEFAHLWNVYRFQPSDTPEGGGYWLDEGQAEASAIEASVKLGWMSRAGANKRYARYINQCLQAMRAAPLAKQNHDAEVIYGCGVTVQLLAEAAVHKVYPKASPYLLWKSVYAAAAKRHDRYSTELFTQQLTSLSHDGALAHGIDVLAGQSAKGKDAFILTQLQKLGFQLRELTTSTDRRDTTAAARGLFTVLMQADCKGAISFGTHPDAVRIYPLKRCAVFNKAYRITAVDGHALYKDAFAAYHAVQRGCAKQGSTIRFQLANKKGGLEMPCPAHIPDFPPIVQLQSVPWSAPAALETASRRPG